MIKVLDALNIKYSHYESDPLEMAKGYVAGDVSPEKYQQEAMAWWKKLTTRPQLEIFTMKQY